MSCKINSTRYFLIQVKLHNNERKIKQALYLCDYLQKKGHHFILNYTLEDNEFLIEVDEKKFRYEYEF